MGSCWLWDKLVVFFTQVSICCHFGVMGVLVMLLEHLARLIASFAETWRHGSFTVPKSVPKSSVLNKIDLTHMLFCIIAGKPGSCFGITSRVRNEWEVAKRGMCGVIKFWCIQLEYTHWMMNISSLLYRPDCIWWNQRVSRCWLVLDFPLLTCLPLLSSTSFAPESSTDASIWAVGSNWQHCFSLVKSWGGECRNRFRDQSFIWLKIGQLVGWCQAGQIHWGYFEVLDASSHPLLYAGIKAYAASVTNRNTERWETEKLCVEADQV